MVKCGVVSAGARKQCRERWFNHLCPEVKKGSWSAEEDRVIMESVARYGTLVEDREADAGRTDNAIKTGGLGHAPAEAPR